jgi:hypothetical protein
MIEDKQVNDYLISFRSHLGSLTISEREEIVREIEAHIRDASEEQGANSAEILTRLGSPEQLAAQYRDGLLIRKASHSYSPILLLRGALRFTRRSLIGIIVVIAGLFGYWLGGAISLIGLLAPIWYIVHPHNTPSYPVTPFAGVALGTLFFLALGCMILLLTTLLMRAALRVFRRSQLPM